MKKRKKRKIKRKNKRNIFTIRYLLIFIIAILIILSISLVVSYNLKEQEKQTNEIVNTSVIKESYSFLLNNNASKVKEDEFISKQEEVKTTINKALSNSSYTIDNPLILKNPYNINPLSAYIIFNTPVSVGVTVTIKGLNNNDLIFNYDSTKNHLIPIYYLYGGITNTITITLSNGTTKEFNIETTEVTNLDISSGIIYSNNIYYEYTDHINAYDEYGYNRLTFTNNTSNIFRILNNGNLLITTSINGTNTNNYANLIEITPVGEVVHIYYLKNGVSSSVVEDSNGDFLYVNNNSIIKVNRQTGEIIGEYNILDIINSINTINVDTLDINSIILNNEDIILSLKNINTIISLDSSFNIKWIYGSRSVFNYKFYKYLLIKLTYNTKFVENVNNILYKDDLLYVYENTMLRVYKINEESKTIKNINSYNTYKLNEYTLPTDSISYELSDTNITFSLENQTYETIDDSTVGTYKKSKGASYDITFIDNHLKINNMFNTESSVKVSLLNPKGYAYSFNYKNANEDEVNYIDISRIEEGKYFIYLDIDNVLYNVGRYIVK